MADIVCRWRNGTPETVVELVQSLPKKKMKSSEFRTIMKGKWKGGFFIAPYQLACQLGLYYESEDGLYYPRFDHDISLVEAHRYLLYWFTRYYVPNPYVGKDGFTKIACPTFVLKSIYEFVELNPGIKYLDAYKRIFKEEAKNNDDIMCNYINSFSSILEMRKDGSLFIIKENDAKFSSHKINAQDKQAFFENFDLNKCDNLMTQYLTASIKVRKDMFYNYLLSIGLKKNSCSQYAYRHLDNEIVSNELKNSTKYTSFFEVIDLFLIDKIYNLILQNPVNKRQNNAISAAIFNYRKFIDFLESETLSSDLHEESKVTDASSKTDEPKFSIESIIKDIHDTGLIYSDTLVKRFAFSLLSKRFLILSGLAGSGKTQLALAFAKALVEDEDKQMCVVSVGADWTNREPLLGFPNALKEDSYVLPESGVLQLLMAANEKENENKPFFLILDEMNMSYVERYFADFLSVMESGEKIRLWEKKDENQVCISPDSSEPSAPDVLVPDKIALPKNLFIIGTINVDETTYMFSPKVLDRANVIEFKISPENMEKFFNMKKIQQEHVKIDGKASGMASSFVELASREDLLVKDDEIKTLQKFFVELKKVNAEFGYRSATEIFRFIAQATDNDDSAEKMTPEQIMDAAIVQKLLPKLHGSRKKLDPVLRKLWSFCFEAQESNAENSAKEVEMNAENIKDKKAIYPESADKILRMHEAAENNGFTSFAEA